MSDGSSAGQRGARAGYETTWLFFRTLMGLLLVAWLVPALFLPPDPLPFLVAMAVLWLVGAVVAWWLVYLDGYALLEARPWYRPGMAAGRALLLFAGLALALKVAGTLAVDQYVGSLPGYDFVDPRAVADPASDGPFDATATDATATNATTTPTETATATPTTTGDGPTEVTPVRQRPYAYDFAVSVVALVGSYLAVYRGFVAWLFEEEA